MTLTLIAALVATYAASAATHHRKPHHSRGYLLAVQLNRALASTPMRGTGWALATEGRAAGVHPAFIAAVAGKESSYGAQPCRANRMNVWGLSSCRRGWAVPQFRTWRQAIRFFAHWFQSRFAYARTPYDVHGYCVTGSGADCPSWAADVAYRMRALGFAPSTRWPG